MKGIGKVCWLLNNMEYFLDEYEYYNFDFVVIMLSYFRKGWLKKEVSLNMNRFILFGYEWKVLIKF